MTVHLVIKQSPGSGTTTPSPAGASSPAPSTTPAHPPPAANIGASPFGLGGLGGIGGMGNLGMGSANFMEMQQRVQRDLMSNPDMLRQVGYTAIFPSYPLISPKLNLLHSIHPICFLTHFKVLKSISSKKSRRACIYLITLNFITSYFSLFLCV